MIKSLLTAGVISLATITPVIAQNNNCNTYERAQESLTNGYGEYPVWEGLVSSFQFIVQLWVNPQTGTWTALTVSPDGMACVVSDGMPFTFIDPPVNGEPM
jgi:hypothetical protein